jgi:hypothetical protein
MKRSMQHGMAMLMNPVRPLMVATRDQQGDLKGTGIFFFFSLHFFYEEQLCGRDVVLL